jgi:hypothetical protein
LSRRFRVHQRSVLSLHLSGYDVVQLGTCCRALCDISFKIRAMMVDTSVICSLTVLDIPMHRLSIPFQSNLDPSRVLPIARVTLFNLSKTRRVEHGPRVRSADMRLQSISCCLSVLYSKVPATHLVYSLETQRATRLGDVETLGPPEGFLPGHTTSGSGRCLCIKVDRVDRVPSAAMSKYEVGST